MLRKIIEDLNRNLTEIGVSPLSINTILPVLSGLEEIENGISRGQKDLDREVKNWRDEEIIPSLIKGSKEGAGTINFIPAVPSNLCHELLFVVAAGETEFNLFSMEAIAHCINCHRKGKAVVILSTWWSETEFNKWRKPPFRALYSQFGTHLFVIAPHGGGLKLVKILF